LRILTVTHFFESHGGGIERVAGHLNRQFVRLGETAVWAASDCDPPPVDGIETVPLACANPIEKVTGLPMPIPGIKAMRAMSREVRRSDVIVVHDALYVTSIAALALAKKHKKPVVLIQHIAAIAFSSAILRWIMRLANIVVTQPMLHAANIRVFISNTVREELLGVDSRLSSALLFNGVDKEIFRPSNTEVGPPDCVSKIAIPANSRRILFVGRYVEKKGLSVLRALAAQCPNHSFFLVGSGPIQPSSWGLTNVHDVGPRGSQEVADFYRWADLLLLPSVGEGYPLVIQEAMASGLPVICGEPSNRADPDAGAWLRGVRIELSDPEGSARRCADAINNFTLSEAARTEMARYAARKYDWEDVAGELIRLTRTADCGTPDTNRRSR
jgi:glycosyltransferase involved in cell wall biosynthesis